MSYSEIDPVRAVIYALPVTQYDEIVGGELLTDPYNPAYWTPVNGGVLSTVPGYTLPNAIRVTAGASAYYGMSKNPFVTPNHRYRLSFNGRADANRGWFTKLGSAALIPDLAAAWRNFSVDATANGALFEFSSNTGAVGWAEFDALSLKELRRVVKNHGRAVVGGVQAPSVLVCGDGYTASKFPTMRQPRGMTFDGGDFLQVPNSEMPDLGNVFTHVCLFKSNNKSPAAPYELVSKDTSNDAAHSPYLLEFLNDTVLGYIGDGVSFTSTGALPAQKGSFHCAAFVADANTIAIYVDGVLKAPVVRNRNSVANAAALTIGAINTAGTYGLVGQKLGVAIYPTALSQQSLRELERRLRQAAQIA